ncbi:MAG: hypothetical protein SPL73_02330 [Cyanobacteriota bacterium]|nr:hypothetical protein [Cyanobacteriota bacterium]MDY6363707.1 hypothetical protein [Cyanobacteriota bacterium]MDY6383572.1 hypothetical protein [Cyanobacteriota bacterium]
MILEGMFFENTMNYPTNRIYPQYPTITAGVQEGTEAIYRYGLRESSYPTLSIVDPIPNGHGQVIPAGHYELALSDDRQFLLLLEAKNPIAVMPVFKLEVSTEEKAQVHDAKSLRKKNKHDKEIIRTNTKRAKKGMPPVNEEEEIYQEASMEYIKDGKYFLIRYERGDVKAWAAVKAE